MSHGSDRQAAPACSKTVYMVSARIDGRRQRHGNVMTSVRIVDRFQDTTGVQEPCHGEIFCWRGEMHAKFASIRSPTAGKQRSGTALLRRGVCAMFGEAGKRPWWRLLQIARRPISAAKPPLNSEIAAARNEMLRIFSI